MKLNEFITYFRKTKKTGENQYTALCPAHNDRRPSLSIGFSPKDNHILIHCHAGCKAEDVLNSVGLSLKDLYQEKEGVNIMEKTTYTYYNENGTVAYTKTRTDYNNGSKKFYFKSPEGKMNINGIQRKLYNLPAILNADKIYFVEGEKCAEALIKKGAVATTLDSGAKSHWFPHYNEYLQGKEVIIVPDNDIPGMEYAKMILHNVPTARIVILPGLSNKEDVFDWLSMGHTIQEIDELPALEITEDTETNIEKNDTNTASANISSKETQAETIIRLTEEKGAVFFHDDVKMTYVSVINKEHREVWRIDSEVFHLWLGNIYFSAKKKTANSNCLQQAKEIFKAKALFENIKNVLLETRVAKTDNVLWYNLCNENWQAVKITKDGWEIDNNPPILFKRYDHQKCQLIPNKEGDIKRILKYINLQENHTLFLCWLVSCFIPSFPHAMPIFFGEKGAAKTTACVLLKKLIDPSELETLTIPKSARSLAINLQQHWFLPFDNISHIDYETSDTLCRAITGGGIQQRKLYTDDDDYIFKFQKCLALNGINNVANRPDLLDRAILIKLQRIDESCRRELSALTLKFEEDMPYILGGIFDTLVKAINIYPTVHLDNLPRMADFARWGYAIGQALGDLGKKFIDEYNSNQEARNIEILNTDIIATLIIGFMQDKHEWSGFISELYNKLLDLAPQYGIKTNDKNFPKQPNILSRRLNNLQSNLKQAGISFITVSKMQGTEITLTNEKISPLPPYHQPIVRLEGVNSPSIEDVDVDISEDDTEEVEF